MIVVEGSGQLTIEDSNTSNLSHKFNPNGKLWVLDEASGTEAVTGGVITGGTGTDISTFGGTTWYCGGGALIKNGGSLTMRGGNIIGCSAECGGGVCIDSEQGQFSMSGGSIAGCVASDIGGGVFASGTFKMSGQAVIRSCTAESATQYVCGGGVYVNVSSSFEMSDTAIIEGCQAIATSSNSSNGGGVYVSSSSSFVMSGEAKIEGCQAISNSSNSSNGGGVYLANNTKFTLSGSAVIQNCTATNSANSGEAYGGGVSAACVKEITLADSARIVGCAAANGSGLYITGSQVPGYGILYANSGSVDGDVVLGDTEDGPSTITGSGGTVFNGKVTVTPGSTIKSGTFNGEVINNGTITGGVFNNTVSGSGTITGGIFNTPMTGSGTETDPYQISTAEQLKLFRDIVNGAGGQTQNRGAYAVLTADIDLNNEPWTPIGPDRDSAYTGTFDGQGHTVKNLSVTVNVQPGRAGLFGCVKDGTIRKLTVAGSVSCTANQGWCGGIAGYAMDETIENCASLCTVSCTGIDARVGGIVGLVDYNSRTLIIRDCYNIGKITGRSDNGSGDAGGICGFYMNGKISNCYNVGEITGSGYVSKIAVSAYNDSRPTNCYYLSDTDTDLNGTAKTAAEFANGDVLDELKAGRNDSPWDSCQYVAAAKITLPVFKGQGDEHTHNGNWTSNDNGTHSRRCTCNVVETQNCSGGTATCTQKAKCKDCGAEYGDALGHDFTTSWTHDDNMHWKQCSRCDAKDDVSPHTWDSGTVTTAPTCTKAGEETYSCTECGATKTEPIDATGHSWKSDWTSDATHHWHECANESCDVTNNAGKNGYAEHSGGKATCTQNAVCEFCKAEYGEKLPHDFTAETVDAKYLKSAATCTEKAVYYKSCAVCGLSSEGTADEATFFSGNVLDHDWGAWTQNSDEKTHTRICKRDTSHTETENCHGGTATCTQRATCTVCGAEYGDALGHDFTTSWTHDDNMHWKQCSRCDAKDDVSPHTWDSGTVTTAPTCTKAGEETYSCTECGATKTEPIDATGHSWKSDWTSDATHHWHECANESCDVTNNAGKNGYAEHSGGKATCTQNAVCEICKESYGSLDPNNHTDLKHIDAKAATAAEEGNIAYWYCDGCKKYFSDAAATKEITKAATVTAKLPPKITAGDGAAVTQGEKKELTFTSDASFADFLRVELDGTALEEKNYTKREGSTIITLNRDFVATLSAGEHTLAIVSQRGTATAKFTVKAKPTETATPQPTVTPQPTAQPTPTVQPVSPILRTGDTANPALWFALLIVSGGAAIGITVASRKKKHNK